MVKPDDPLPGALYGSDVTIRSIDELLLAPHGLAIRPSADDTKLVITRRIDSNEPESYFQNRRGKKLTERLDQKPDSEPIEIREKDLLSAIKEIAEDLNMPFAIDAKAMHDGKIDPKAKVTGKFGDAEPRKSLLAMLEPLGLTIEVRSEVVFVTLKGH